MAAVQTAQFVNTQYGTDEAQNPWSIVQETTQSDYRSDTSVRRVITVNSTLTRQHFLAHPSSAGAATNDTASERELHHNQAAAEASGSGTAKKRSTKLMKFKKNLVRLLLCGGRAGEDQDDDAHSKRPTERFNESVNADTAAHNRSSENVSHMSRIYNILTIFEKHFINLEKCSFY